MSLVERSIGIISDGNGGKIEVRPGNLVNLLPTHPDKPEGEDRRYLSHRHAEFLRTYLQEHQLGDGPYLVAWIGLWPCGRFNLYVGPTRNGPGIKARDFCPAAR